MGGGEVSVTQICRSGASADIKVERGGASLSRSTSAVTVIIGPERRELGVGKVGARVT